MSNNFLRSGNLDSDFEVDEVKGKIRSRDVLTGLGNPIAPPPVPEKSWMYYDVTDDLAAVGYVWDPDGEAWCVTASAGGSAAPLIIAIPADEVVVEVPGPEVSLDIVLRLLPSNDGSTSQHIKLAKPTGSGQRVSAVVGVNLETPTGNEWPGEAVYYVGDVLDDGTRATLDFTSVSGLTYPIALDCSFDLTFDVQGPAPTVVNVVLSDTYADSTALAIALLGQTNAAQVEHLVSFGVFPENGALVGYYATNVVAGSITVDNIVGTDDFAVALATADSVTGVAPAPTGDTIEYGVLKRPDGTLGTPVGGGTHTSPSNLDPHMKGWEVIDIADGVWSVQQWAPRLQLLSGGWTETQLGPLGKNEEQGSLQGMLDNVRAFLVPEAPSRTLVRGSRSQLANTTQRDRFVLFQTEYDSTDIEFTLEDPNGAQPDPTLPYLDYGCRGYELDFWRHPDDNPLNTVLIGYPGSPPFGYNIAPGEHVVVRSQLVSYVDPDLPAGTGPGDLDHPANQVYGWVDVSNGVPTGAVGDILANVSGTWEPIPASEVDAATWHSVVATLPAVATAQPLNFESRWFNVTMAADTAFYFDTFIFNPLSGGLGSMLTLVLSGAFTPTFTGVLWAGGTPPAHSGTSVWRFWTLDGGTTVYGELVGAAFS